MNPVLQNQISNDLLIYMQPIYHAKTLEIVSYEILSRLWINGTYYNPQQFLKGVNIDKQYPLAIAVLTRLPKIIECLDERLKLHVNFNPDDFNSKRVFDLTLQFKDRIIVEITEESGNIDNKVEILQALKREGVCVALDDFGDKNSTYNYVVDKKECYGLFDMIKIDGSLIKSIDIDDNRLKFLRSIMKTMRDYPQTITFEYVENEKIKNLAIELGADYLQGHYFAEAFDSRHFLEQFKYEKVGNFK